MRTLYDKLPFDVRSMSRTHKFTLLLMVDVCVVPLAVLMSCWLTGEIVPFYLVVLLALSGAAASVFLGLPRIKLNAFEQKGIVRTTGYAVLVGTIGLSTSMAPLGSSVGIRHFVIFTMILAILSVTARLSIRSILLAIYRMHNKRQPVIIYGAGKTGVQLAAALGADDTLEPVAFIDDNPSLHQAVVAGLRVSPPARAGEMINHYGVKRVVLAMPSLSRPKRVRIAHRFKKFGCEVVALPSFSTLLGQRDIINSVEPVSLSSYLGRTDLNDHLGGSTEIYKGRSVLVTGAGGSIGSELSRQVIQCRPTKIILLDISEKELYLIDRELSELNLDAGTCEIIPVLGSVTNEKLVERVIRENSVDTVLHAAAYKHVPLVEKNCISGLFNNIIGTQVLAKTASRLNVGTFIFVSTDKAVRPRSIMGGSKRFAEMIIQDLATRSAKTRFSIVRFGNVLGSSGSVVPLFEEQIARGGPVTLTHQDVTRYFMTIGEAARLVLCTGALSLNQSEQGQVYVLDMGEPVRIRELATSMIENAGYTVCDHDNPSGDIEIIVTGMRAGEKLHEQLSTDKADMQPTTHPKIMRVEEEVLSELEMVVALRDLANAIEGYDQDTAVHTLRHWVGMPDLTHSVEGPVVGPKPVPAPVKKLHLVDTQQPAE